MQSWCGRPVVALAAGLAMACLAASVSVSAAASEISFSDSCGSGERLTIAAVGDIIYHKQLLVQAFRKGGNFSDFWSPVGGVIAAADLAYANLEGPAASGTAAGGASVRDPGRQLDYRVYGYKLPNLSFNYHPDSIDDIKASGFDVISTANNHAMDRGVRGIERTVDKFVEAGLPFTGTRRKGEIERPWHVVTPAKGFNIAWLACTYSTNGIPDRHQQVLFCYKDREIVLEEVRRLTAKPGIDAVIVTPHWGDEDHAYVNARQKKLGAELIEAGAAAVVGSHPHLVQGWQKHVARDGREGLIVYSTGNFISNQRKLPQRTGIIAMLELTRDEKGQTRLTSAGFIPTWVAITGVHRVKEMGRAEAGALRALLRILPEGNRLSIDAIAANGGRIDRCPKSGVMADAN